MEVVSCLGSLWGGRGAADKCHWRVWRVLSVLATLGLSLLAWHMLSPSTLLRLQAALQGAGPEFVHFPGLTGTPQRRRLGWACVLCLPRPSSSGSQETDERTFPWCGMPYPLHGCSLSFQARWLGAPCVLFWEADFWL